MHFYTVRPIRLSMKNLLFIGVALLSVLLLAGTAAAADKTYNLTIQSAFPRGDVSVPLLDVFCQSAEKRSNGQIKIKWFAAPEIVPPEQLLDAVKMGTLDMLQSVGAYWAGVMPAGDVEFGLPMAYNMPWVNGIEAKAGALRDLYFKEGLIDIIREAYAEHGHYYLGMFTSGPVVVLSSKSLKTLADWKGIKLRADGQNMQYYETAGAKATTIPGTESYLALKLGTIDAAEWDVSAITGLNWHEVAPHWVVGMETFVVMDLTINLELWNSLPEPLKEALRGAEQDYYDATLQAYKKEFATVDELIKNKKVIVDEIDQESRDFFAKQAALIWDAQAKKDPHSAKAIDLIKKWIEKNKQ